MTVHDSNHNYGQTHAVASVSTHADHRPVFHFLPVSTKKHNPPSTLRLRLHLSPSPSNLTTTSAFTSTPPKMYHASSTGGGGGVRVLDCRPPRSVRSVHLRRRAVTDTAGAPLTGHSAHSQQRPPNDPSRPARLIAWGLTRRGPHRQHESARAERRTVSFTGRSYGYKDSSAWNAFISAGSRGTRRPETRPGGSE